MVRPDTAQYVHATTLFGLIFLLIVKIFKITLMSVTIDIS